MMMPTRAQAEAQLARMHGSYLEVVVANAPMTWTFQTMYFGLLFFWRAGGMMLLGMCLYRTGFLGGQHAARTYALAAVGRMALTNYLMHSIVTAVIFLGWGFGAAGSLDYAGQLWVVAAIWAVQLVASLLWLARFRFGPAEWLWRSLTYRHWQPVLR